MRWNAKIDTDGTPPLLAGLARDPDDVEKKVQALAKQNNCKAELWWDKFSWAARVSVEGTPAGAQRVLQALEATDVVQEVTSTEKQRHPNAK